MAGNGIVEVTDANFDQDVLKSDQPVLVDFWATWCGPCRALAPIVDELAKDYQGKIKVGKMDVDSNSATPMRYKVTGIPTLLVFKGGQVVEQLVGYKPKDAVEIALDDIALDAALEPIGVDDQPAIMRDGEFARPHLAGAAVDLDLGDDRDHCARALGVGDAPPA